MRSSSSAPALSLSMSSLSLMRSPILTKLEKRETITRGYRMVGFVRRLNCRERRLPQIAIALNLGNYDNPDGEHGSSLVWGRNEDGRDDASAGYYRAGAGPLHFLGRRDHRSHWRCSVLY